MPLLGLGKTLASHPTPSQTLQRTLGHERLQAQLVARDKDLILSKERMLEESHKEVQQLLKELEEAKRQITNRQFDELISDAELMAEKDEKALGCRRTRLGITYRRWLTYRP